MRNRRVLVGVDLGTTKVKGAAYDLSGQRLAHAAIGYPTQRPRPGWAEQDPSHWWLAVREVLANVQSELKPDDHIASIGVCSQVNTHVFVAEDGTALLPAITWQDQRCVPTAETLNLRLTDADRQRIWGESFTVDASYLLARAAWVRDHEPDVWRATRWVLSPKDFINLRLTGCFASDPISSIGLTGQDGAYLSGLDDLVGGVEWRLPPLGEHVGLLVRTAGGGELPADVCVANGTMDAWGSIFGSGITKPGLGMQVGGTSEIIAMASDGGPGARGVVTFAPWRGLRVHAGPTQAGGDALRWAAVQLALAQAETLDLAATSEPASRGLVFLPQLQGERAPLWDPHLRAGWLGMSFEHTRADLARAVLEGVACSARHLLEAVEEAGGQQAQQLALSGGAAASDLWSQIKSDVSGRSLQRLREHDSGVLGAAMMGAMAAGIVSSLEEGVSRMVSVERVFTPDPDRRERYDELYRTYRSAQDALSEVFRPSPPGKLAA